MQTVLSVDATQDPPVGIIAEVDGTSIKVVERKELLIGAGSSIDDLLLSSSAPEEHNTDSAQAVEFSTQFTSAIVIIPPLDYLSALLSLPFKETRQLSKVVDAEIQDLLPFDTAEFVLQHRSVGSRREGVYEVHVGALPRHVVRNALGWCRLRGIDPVVLTTPASIMQAAAAILGLPDDLVLFCYISDRFCHLAVCSGGTITMDRSIDRSAPYTNGAHGGSLSTATLLYRIKLEIASLERKADQPFQRIVLVDSMIDPGDVEKLTGRPTQAFNVAEVTRNSSTPPNLAVLGALLAEDSRAGAVLTNFRVGEFAFRPPLKELLSAILILRPFILLTLVLAAVYFATNFFVVENEISSLREAVASQIRAVAPQLNVTDGDDLRALNLEINRIEDELKDLGSPAAYSPLETLADISSAMPSISDVTVDKLSIKGNRISLDGCAPDYRAIETIEGALNKNATFANVKKQSAPCSSGRPNGRGFRFELWLKE